MSLFCLCRTPVAELKAKKKKMHFLLALICIPDLYSMFLSSTDTAGKKENTFPLYLATSHWLYQFLKKTLLQDRAKTEHSPQEILF